MKKELLLILLLTVTLHVSQVEADDSNSGSSSVIIGPIGTLLVLIVITYCCCKRCNGRCGRQTGDTIAQQQVNITAPAPQPIIVHAPTIMPPPIIQSQAQPLMNQQPYMGNPAQFAPPPTAPPPAYG